MSNTKKATNPIADEGFSIEYAGEVYEFTRDDLDDMELLQLIMAGNPFSAVQYLLGDDWGKRYEESVRTSKGKVPWETSRARCFPDALPPGSPCRLPALLRAGRGRHAARSSRRRTGG